MAGKPSLTMPPSSVKSSDVRSETRLPVSKRFLPTLARTKVIRYRVLCLRAFRKIARATRLLAPEGGSMPRRVVAVSGSPKDYTCRHRRVAREWIVGEYAGSECRRAAASADYGLGGGDDARVRDRG